MVSFFPNWVFWALNFLSLISFPNLGKLIVYAFHFSKFSHFSQSSVFLPNPHGHNQSQPPSKPRTTKDTLTAHQPAATVSNLSHHEPVTRHTAEKSPTHKRQQAREPADLRVQFFFRAKFLNLVCPCGSPPCEVLQNLVS